MQIYMRGRNQQTRTSHVSGGMARQTLEKRFLKILQNIF